MINLALLRAIDNPTSAIPTSVSDVIGKDRDEYNSVMNKIGWVGGPPGSPNYMGPQTIDPELYYTDPKFRSWVNS